MRQRIKKFCASVLAIIASLYFFSMFIMSSYYWWKDVKSHNSFARAIIWSPVVGMFKATHWPYYVFFKKNKLSDKELKSVQSFFKAYRYVYEIQQIAKKMPTSKTFQSDLKLIESLINKTLETLSKCDKEILNNIHPEWGDITYSKFRPACEYISSGIDKNGNFIDFTNADLLLAEFDAWIRSNWNDIALKVSD